MQTQADLKPITPKKRTLTQNDSLHLYLSQIAHELTNQGQTLQDVVKKIDMCEITPTTKTVKEVIWRPIQEATLGKKSSTELTTAEINQVYEIISMFLAKEFEISIPFPSYELTDNYLKSYDK